MLQEQPLERRKFERESKEGGEGLADCNTRRIISYNLGETLSRFLSQSLTSSLSLLTPYSTTPFLPSRLLSPSCVWREWKARGKIVSWWEVEGDGESLGTIDCRVPWGKSILQGHRPLPTVPLSPSCRRTLLYSLFLSPLDQFTFFFVPPPLSSTIRLLNTPRKRFYDHLYFETKNKHQSTLHRLKEKTLVRKEGQESSAYQQKHSAY